jgi:tRNA(Ile)-lysidine synthase
VQQEFNNHITKNFSSLRKAKILIAISGGIDSVVLTYLFYNLKFNISLAHCNFKLRDKESDKDELFVKKLANNLQTTAFVTSFNTQEYATNNKLSIQESARNLRYNWFYKLAKENQFDYIVTAHNLNDNLETFLIHLTRGTGLQGLTGIPIINDKTVRPLLEFSRKQIINFAKENKIIWREDQSNKDTKYTRNKIRHQVIPVLEEINPKLLSSFKKTLEHLKGSEDLVNDAVNSKFKLQTSKFNIKEILKTNNPKAYLYEILKNYGFTQWNDVLNLLTAQSGKQVFSKTHRLIKDRDYLLLTLRKENKEKGEERREEREDDLIKIKEKDTELKIQNSKFKIQTTQTPNPKPQTFFQFDKDLLKFPLQVRKWENGDYFYPLGMTGKKKLSKFFKDEKYSLLEKENIWLLLSDNQIVWIIGKRQDNRFKVTETTEQILEITQI